MPTGIEVRGNLEGAIKRFKIKSAKDGILTQARKKQDGYKKPGVQRREAIKEGIKNTRKNNKKRRDS